MDGTIPTSAAAATTTLVQCAHCGAAVPAGSALAPYCCAGCRAARALLQGAGLERYYALRRGSGAPVVASDGDAAAIAQVNDVVAEAASTAGDGVVRVALDVQGVQCAACCWLVEELCRRDAAVRSAVLNPALGRLELVLARGTSSIAGLASTLARVGYRLGPPTKQAPRGADDLLVRFGVTAAFAMNAMIVAAAFYFGLSPEDDPLLSSIFAWAGFAFCTGAVAVGGTYFFRSAARSLARGLVHLDLPIAAGIALSYATSTWDFLFGAGRAAYFDTVAVFTALMLLGRMLERRVVEKNRRALLEDDGVEGLRVRLLDERGGVRAVPAGLVKEGDRLLVAPGEILPVKARLLDDGALFALDWVNGEPEPRAFAAGALVPAGAHDADARAVRLVAAEDFSASRLHALLARADDEDGPARVARFWQRLARAYVVVVLALAAAAFLVWLPAGPQRALEVVTAMLVVTCPCALGIATPLAYELALVRLRRIGVFVRAPSFLDRALDVRKIVLDKTGTLTLGQLRLADDDAIRGLDDAARRALVQTTARSNHPKSRALAAALAESGPLVLDESARVREEPGRGVIFEDGGATWTLGRAAGGAPDEVELARDGEPVARFAFVEELRHDAVAEVRGLVARGLEVHVLSGDAQERVDALASRLRARLSSARGDLSPEDKARIVEEIDRGDTLMIGDGVNDAPAFRAAHAAGTPAVDRPQLPARADFYLLGTGLGPIGRVLDVAGALRRVVHRNLALSLSYNALVVALAFMGVLDPLLVAVMMPASSLVIVSSVLVAFEKDAALRRSP